MNELRKYIKSMENSVLERNEVENLCIQVIAYFFSSEILVDEFCDMVLSISRLEVYRNETINPRIRNLLEQILIKHTDYGQIEKRLNALLFIAVNLQLPNLVNKIKRTACYWEQRDSEEYCEIMHCVNIAEKNLQELMR